VSSLPVPEFVFRTMVRAADEWPVCGSRTNHLGVRPGVDIKVDGSGDVHPVSGGMSGAPDDPKKLPPHLRPPVLGGWGKLPVYRIRVSEVTHGLSVRRDSKYPRKHVFIEPSQTMALSGLQSLLCGDRAEWSEVVL